MPINSPLWGFFREISRVLGVIVILFLEVLVVLRFLLLLISLVIRVKERECVQVVFEGDKLIQVILHFLLSIYLVFSFAFTFLF